MAISTEQREVLTITLAAVRWHDAREYMQYKAEDPWAAFVNDPSHMKNFGRHFDKVATHDQRNKELVKLLFHGEALAPKLRAIKVKGQIGADQKAVLTGVLGIIRWHEAHNVMQYKTDDPWESFKRDQERNRTPEEGGMDIVTWRNKLCLGLVKLLFSKGVIAERLVSDGD